jgi:hypothetical protein
VHAPSCTRVLVFWGRVLDIFRGLFSCINYHFIEENILSRAGFCSIYLSSLFASHHL